MSRRCGAQHEFRVCEFWYYRPNAYRLLLSKRNIQAGLVIPYDPEKDEGPLRLKNGKYYWNYEFTSEFMIEDDLSLEKSTGLTFVTHHDQYCRFVTHHDQYCRPFGNGCEDRTKQPSPQRTGGRMLSFVRGNGMHVLDNHFKPPGANSSTWLNMGYDGLEGSLPAQVRFAGPISANGWCQDVVRGSLALYGADQVDQARKLLALISSKDNFTRALKAIVRAHFGDPKWEPDDF